MSPPQATDARQRPKRPVAVTFVGLQYAKLAFVALLVALACFLLYQRIEEYRS